MQIDWNARRILTSLMLCGVAASLAGCGAREPPVVEMLTVSIDADNNCSMENKGIECAQVAAVILAKYPTSKPRVDICLAPETRYEAATEVMQSVTAAGFTFGSFDCGQSPAG
jgi:biopolymer transport protein ExbD